MSGHPPPPSPMNRLSALLQLALVQAYRARLTDVCAVLEGYGSRLGGALVHLGLPPAAEGPAASSGAASRAPEPVASQRQLRKCIARWHDVIASATTASLLSPDALLEVCERRCPLPVGATAPAPAVLALLEEGVQGDLVMVRAWAVAAQEQRAGTGQGAAQVSSTNGNAAVAAAIGRLQTLHIGHYQGGRAAAQQERELRAKVEAAHEAARAAPAGEARLRTLAAQQAGLQAALAEAERQRARLAEHYSDAAERGARARRQLQALAAAEEEEAALDARVVALCRADLALQRGWRQGAWEARAFVEDRLLRRVPELQVLGRQLEAALGEELQAFAELAWPTTSGESGCRRGNGAAAIKSAIPLDALAPAKTEAHARELLAAAEAELERLRPLREQWAGLLEAAKGSATQLQGAAADLEARLAVLQEEAAGSSAAALAAAEAAAAEGRASVAEVREALREWWASPAVHVVPWVKHEGKNASEWLRLLIEQSDAQKRRAALGDFTNVHA